MLKHFNETWALGIAGYYYHQITGDSGPGARIGLFEGRAVGLGPILTRNVTVDGKQVTTSTRWLHGYYAVNRTRGDSVLLSIGIPIHVGAPQFPRTCGHAAGGSGSH
ncbi:outer membrane putative beta-barrel porin/alpha-amylase [Tepidamorphus gemmatus]|uniref:Outer membrane putative beta-barrel porin/alpha-amylase n=1 Tax=Tepidamorphus gemmatus TaxID=747076 RepID=A0A4R3MDS5_9HYPH|nr:outer membrane putative beta-barrel porin/alpha-amylase [Tepidamorphus gemmatus]